MTLAGPPRVAILAGLEVDHKPQGQTNQGVKTVGEDIDEKRFGEACDSLGLCASAAVAGVFLGSITSETNQCETCPRSAFPPRLPIPWRSRKTLCSDWCVQRHL